MTGRRTRLTVTPDLLAAERALKSPVRRQP